MTMSQERPALIQYACERCKKELVLPPSSRHLGLSGKFYAFWVGLGRTFRYHEGPGTGYGEARHQLLTKADDEAYQSFAKSFHFCPRCRQFVCNECWSASRGTCWLCATRATSGAAQPLPPVAPVGLEVVRPVPSLALRPRGRTHRAAPLVAFAVALVLLVFGGGLLLASVSSGPTASPAIADRTAAPTPSPTATSRTGTSSPSPMASAGESPSAASSAGPTEVGTPTTRPTAGPTRTPNSTPRRTPAPTPRRTPTPRPTAAPTATPTAAPTATPTETPTATPTETPTP
jgi:hypothetical protein